MEKDKLISANALLSYIDCGHLRSPTELCFSELDLKNIVEKLPAVDAVVIPCRCFECDACTDDMVCDEWSMKNKNGEYQFQHYVSQMGYCSYSWGKKVNDG